MADVMMVPLATIVDHDRKLTKAGLRTKGGRGLSVANVTPLDAARLLTSLLAGTHATDAAAAVERYTQTNIDKARSSDPSYVATELGAFAKLPVGHSFVDALELVIASAGTGSFGELKEKMNPHVEVFALTRATRGRLRITGLPDGQTVTMEYGPTETKSGKANRPSTEQVGGDFEQSRRVTDRTIFAIATLLEKENPDVRVQS